MYARLSLPKLWENGLCTPCANTRYFRFFKKGEVSKKKLVNFGTMSNMGEWGVSTFFQKCLNVDLGGGGNPIRT